MKLFKMRPKVHMMGEICLEMLVQGEKNLITLNPLSTSTWTDEDYIGRVSKVQRSCHSMTSSFSTLQKVLGLYSMQFMRSADKRRKR